MEARDQKLIDDVERRGWHVVLVASAENEPYEPPFAYTVGLGATFSWPELLCYGLDREVGHAVLNDTVEELRTRGQTPVAGLVLQDVLQGYDLRLVEMDRTHFPEHLGYALWFARHRSEDPATLRCLQVLWPDRDGRFPDEADCSSEVKASQPVLA